MRAGELQAVIACMLDGLARWEPARNSKRVGEVCVDGMRYSTHRNDDGVPELHSTLIMALLRADLKGQPSPGENHA